MKRFSMFAGIFGLSALLLVSLASCGGGGSGSQSTPDTLTLEELPSIDVSYPARGATIQGDPGSQNIEITGTVTSNTSTVASFKINGQTVALSSEGAFIHSIATMVGGNTLLMEATDEAGVQAKRVQAFTWSTDYQLPTGTTGLAEPATAVWLSQEAVDDGDHSLPLDDLATVLDVVFQSIDIGGLFDPSGSYHFNPYDVYIESFSSGTISTTVALVDGGLQLNITIYDIIGDLRFTCAGDFFTCLAFPNARGEVTADSITYQADLLLAVVPDHTLEVTAANTDVSVNGLALAVDNALLDSIIGPLLDVFVPDLAQQIEDELGSQLYSAAIPILEDGFRQLPVDLSLDFPNLGNSGISVTVELTGDFSAVDISQTEGLKLVTRMGASSDAAISIANLGVPGRAMCGLGPQVIEFPRSTAVEHAASIDSANHQLYAQWLGGRFSFDLPANAIDLADSELTAFTATASALLAPTISDCNPESDLKGLMGEIRLDFSFVKDSELLEATAYANIEYGLVPLINNGALELHLEAIESLDVQLEFMQDEGLGAADDVMTIVDDYLRNGISVALGATPVAIFPLPIIDFSNDLGLPPGFAVLEQNPGAPVLLGGTLITGGSF